MQLLIIILAFFLVDGRKVPDYIPKCKRSDPQIEKCIINGVEVLRPRFRAGIPEINLPPLEPFKMDRLAVNSSVTGLTVNAAAMNLIAFGASNFKIDSLKIDLNGTYAADVKLTVPHLDVMADYSSRGSRMLFIEYVGGGQFKGVFTGVTIEVKAVAAPVLKEGVEYLKVNSITTKVLIDSGDMEVDPSERSFKGSMVSTFAHGSPSIILRILRPVIDETAAPIVKKYVDDVLATIPLEDVLINS